MFVTVVIWVAWKQIETVFIPWICRCFYTKCSSEFSTPQNSNPDKNRSISHFIWLRMVHTICVPVVIPLQQCRICRLINQSIKWNRCVRLKLGLLLSFTAHWLHISMLHTGTDHASFKKIGFKIDFQSFLFVSFNGKNCDGVPVISYF